MNNLKFRAWHKEKKVMRPVGQIRFNVVHATQELIDKEIWVSVDLHKAWEKWLSSEVELMQWTGLTDDENKEIYEGDIVEIISTISGLVPDKASIVNYNGCFVAASHEMPGVYKTFDNVIKHEMKLKVIGNIYEQ